MEIDEMKAMVVAVGVFLVANGSSGCASVSPEKREQVERAQQTGVYSYQRVQRANNAQAVSRSR